MIPIPTALIYLYIYTYLRGTSKKQQEYFPKLAVQHYYYFFSNE